MKKFLSIFLVTAMLLSTFSFAAPISEAPAETADELVETAELFANQESALTRAQVEALPGVVLVAKEDFDGGVTGELKGQNVSYVNPNFGPLTFSSDGDGNPFVEGSENKCALFFKVGQWTGLNIEAPNQVLKGTGTYYLFADYLIMDEQINKFDQPVMFNIYHDAGTYTYAPENVTVTNNWTTFGYQWDVTEEDVTNKITLYSTCKAEAVNATWNRIDNIYLYFVPAGETVESVALGYEMDTMPTFFGTNGETALTNGVVAGGKNYGQVKLETFTEEDGTTATKITQAAPSGFANAVDKTMDGQKVSVTPAQDFMRVLSDIDLPAADLSKIEFKVKFDSVYDDRTSEDVELFWGTDVYDMYAKGHSTVKSSVTANTGYQTVTITAAQLGADLYNSKTLKQLRFDFTSELYASEAFYVDYIRIYSNRDIPTEVMAGVTFAPADGVVDYRSREVKVTFPKALNATPEQVAAGWGDAFSFVSYDEATYTYTLAINVAGRQRGKTVVCKGNYIYGTEVYKMPDYTIKFTSDYAHDGENLMPNGDFSLNSTGTMSLPWADHVPERNIENGILTIGSTSVHAYGTNRAIDWFNEVELEQSATQSKYYYVEYKARMNPKTAASYESFIQNSVYDASGNVVSDPNMLKQHMIIYAPNLDGNTSSNPNAAEAHFSYPSYIPNTVKYGNVYEGADGMCFGMNVGPEWVTRAAVYRVDPTDELSTSGRPRKGIFLANICLEGEYYTDAAKTDKIDLGSNLVDFDYFIFKEMFNVNFVAGDDTATGTAPEVMFAKDVEITLPENPFSVDGKLFAGWSYNGETYAPGDVITFTVAGDQTVTATWVDSANYVAPIHRSEQVRFADGTTKEGLRLKSSVTGDQKKAAAEYGYIIALKATLDAKSLTPADLKFNCGVKYVSGPAYKADVADYDYVYGTDNLDGVPVIYYTGVLTGIPDEHCADNIVARPYIKYVVDGMTVVNYGEPVTTSLAAVAKDTVTKIENGVLNAADFSDENLNRLDVLAKALDTGAVVTE